MGYVNISDYKESLTNPACFFRTILKNMEIGRNCHGEIACTAGSNSAVFDLSDGGREYALKCYTSLDERRDSTYGMIQEATKGCEEYLVNFRYLKDEILVYGGNGAHAYYPVLLMEKIPGKTLGQWLKEKCADRDTGSLEDMAIKFDRMALWLLDKPFAHGDLKHDNIIITPEGKLRLVDLDSMFTPAMAGLPAPELGTPGFRHPRRDKRFFNIHIDDYPLALISTSIHALACFPELYEERHDGENIIFSSDELTTSTCQLLNRLKDYWIYEGWNLLYRLASMLSSKSPVLDGLRDIFAAMSETGFTRDIYGKREIIRRDGFYGFRNTATGDTIAPVYDDAMPFSEGFAAVKLMKRWFYIDTNGKKAIDGEGLEKAGNFSEGLAAVKKGGRYGYIDSNGRMAIEAVFDDARDFREGLAVVGTGGRYGFIERNGHIAIPLAFHSAGDFRGGVAVVEENGKYGYINTRGRYLINPVFDFASGFRGDEATAEMGEEKYRVIKNVNSVSYEKRIHGKDNT